MFYFCKMKIKLLSFFSLVIIIFSQSCSNDFDLIDQWKNIPVVYGLINKNEPVHYIRVEKAYVDPKIGADKLARIPDSIYYDNIKVVLELDSKEYELEKINGEDIGLPKQEGFFANQPNILYKIDSTDIHFKANDEVTLKIYDTQGDSLLTAATTHIVGDYIFAVNYPSDPINFNQDGKTTISWRSLDNEKSAKFYDAKFIIHISEQKEPGSSEYIKKDLTWHFEDKLERKIVNGRPATSTLRKIEGISFFKFLRNNLDQSRKVKRRFLSIDIVVNSGEEALFKYINIGLANTGITSAQTIPTYTNLTHGKGVFSSRNQIKILEMGISTNTKLQLQDNEFTKDLNFE